MQGEEDSYETDQNDKIVEIDETYNYETEDSDVSDETDEADAKEEQEIDETLKRLDKDLEDLVWSNLLGLVTMVDSSCLATTTSSD
jgi:hypothetical protein